MALLGAKEHEAAVKVIHGLLFGNRLPHNRKAEIMKYSCSGAVMPEMNKHVNKLSADDLTLVARSELTALAITILRTDGI